MKIYVKELKEIVDLAVKTYAYGNWSPDCAEDLLDVSTWDFNEEIDEHQIDTVQELTGCIDWLVDWKYNRDPETASEVEDFDPENNGVWLNGNWIEDPYAEDDIKKWIENPNMWI